MLKEKRLHPVGKGELKPEVEKTPELKKEFKPHEHIKPHTDKKHEHEKHLKHKKPILEEMEMLINLSGNKKELKDALVHINNILVDMPKEIKTEVKIKKLNRKEK